MFLIIILKIEEYKTNCISLCYRVREARSKRLTRLQENSVTTLNLIRQTLMRRRQKTQNRQKSRRQLPLLLRKPLQIKLRMAWLRLLAGRPVKGESGWMQHQPNKHLMEPLSKHLMERRAPNAQLCCKKPNNTLLILYLQYAYYWFSVCLKYLDDLLYLPKICRLQQKTHCENLSHNAMHFHFRKCYFSVIYILL